MSAHCPECGASWPDGRTCDDDFYQMLFWENEYPGYGVVHNLLVLCFYLQHPSRYSAAGLQEARSLLTEFVVNGTSPHSIRQRSARHLASDRREITITARPGDQGKYDRAMTWTMRAADVARGDARHYIENVRAWARHLYEDLKRAE